MSLPSETKASPHGHGGHETRDAQSRTVASSLLALLLLVVVAMTLMGYLFYYFTDREAVLDTSASPLQVGRELPPEPRLQPNPPADMETLQAEWDEHLNSYGWADSTREWARIPVEKAMDIVAERGLPTRQSGGEEQR